MAIRHSDPNVELGINKLLEIGVLSVESSMFTTALRYCTYNDSEADEIYERYRINPAQGLVRSGAFRPTRSPFSPDAGTPSSR